MKRGYCHAVEQSTCEAPAGIRAGDGAGACDPGWVRECTFCGEDVCTECSLLLGTHGRMCLPCIRGVEHPHRGARLRRWYEALYIKLGYDPSTDGGRSRALMGEDNDLHDELRRN